MFSGGGHTGRSSRDLHNYHSGGRNLKRGRVENGRRRHPYPPGLPSPTQVPPQAIREADPRLNPNAIPWGKKPTISPPGLTKSLSPPVTPRSPRPTWSPTPKVTPAQGPTTINLPCTPPPPLDLLTPMEDPVSRRVVSPRTNPQPTIQPQPELSTPTMTSRATKEKSTPFTKLPSYNEKKEERGRGRPTQPNRYPQDDTPPEPRILRGPWFDGAGGLHPDLEREEPRVQVALPPVRRVPITGKSTGKNRYLSENYTVRPHLIREAQNQLKRRAFLDAFSSTDPKLFTDFPARWTIEDDAFARSWTESRELEKMLWMNPPFSMMAKVVHKLIEDKAIAIVVAPVWNHTPWWEPLQSITIREWEFDHTISLYMDPQGKPLKQRQWRSRAFLVDGSLPSVGELLEYMDENTPTQQPVDQSTPTPIRAVEAPITEEDWTPEEQLAIKG
jgi:hypothetical protein